MTPFIFDHVQFFCFFKLFWHFLIIFGIAICEGEQVKLAAYLDMILELCNLENFSVREILKKFYKK